MICWLLLLVTGWKIGNYYESAANDEKTQFWHKVSTVGLLGVLVEFLLALFW
jgi:ribulose bisphosphate carboxylase small subunit